MVIKTKTAFCAVLGGGGHAKVVIDCLKSGGIVIPYAILDKDPSLSGKEILGVPIRGGDDLLEDLKKEGVTHFISGIGGVGDNNPRQKIFVWGIQQGLIPLTPCHPSAIISTHAKIGRGTVVFAGAVINPGTVIGENCIINTGAIIDHDCRIGDHAHIAPGVTLSGNVEVGVGAHIGTGASVRQQIRIGKGAIVGAGAVVVKDVPVGALVKGVPAKE